MTGCTDPSSFNYDSTANTDDGSCVPYSYGCIDDSACNYDTTANSSDGSCSYAQEYYDCNDVCLNDSDGDGVCNELEITGCTDSSYLEYSASATDDDGSCLVIALPGCTNDIYAEYHNQDFVANVDDGSCLSLIHI